MSHRGETAPDRGAAAAAARPGEAAPDRDPAATAARPGEAVPNRDPAALAERPAETAPEAAAAELAQARAALAAAADELNAVADRLRSAGHGDEADIVATGVLMAQDPALDSAVAAAIAGGDAAPAALLAACALHADALAALDDATLAARADDVRSLGRRAAALAGGERSQSPPLMGSDPLILVGSDLGPAEVAELPEEVVGIALAAGGPSAHAAVIARGLGIPMVVGAGPELLEVPAGAQVLIDGDAGSVVLDPAAARARAAKPRAQAVAAAGPAHTRDGRRIRVLANVAGPAEVRVALNAGAEGVGLLRTELAFLDAATWPDEAAHRRALGPVLHALAGRTATVRVLDFGADKTPPFLAGVAERGLELLLAAPDALGAQLAAIAAQGGDADLRVLLPMVRDAADVAAVRELTELPLGAMLETTAAIANADEIAAAADFLSIGTNDLVADVLGADRFASTAAAAYDPRVLRCIERAGEAAGVHGRVLEVCGETASDPAMIPLLVGLGVTELSVGAARVRATRELVAALDAAEAETFAHAAAGAASAAAVERLLRERGDAAGELGHRARGVLALGAQP